MTRSLIDFETRSRADLKAVGADIYAKHNTTDILCLGLYDLDSGERALWWPWFEKMPDYWIAKLQQSDEVWAHNARFDRLIWEHIAVPDYGAPKIPYDVWRCSSAAARVNALPPSLDDATRALNTTHRKNHRGAHLIRQLSIPNKKTDEFNEDPELLHEMGEYCEDDIDATADLLRRIRPMSDIECEDWHINERINDRGVRIDTQLAGLAVGYAEQEKDEINERLAELTGGLKASQIKKLCDWTLLQVAPEHAELMKKVDPNTSAVKFTLDKNARAQLLDEPDLPTTVREVLELVDSASKSSVSKFQRMIDMADPVDQRVRGVFIYAGAGQTKRYASRGLQLHNMARACFSAEETEQLKQDMLQGRPLPKPVMHTLSKLLRPALIPAPDHSFVVGDWSAIEARVLPWLSDSAGGEKVLAVFRRDEDIYVATAESMGIDDRQIGKVSNLSLGYGGASGAFNAMAKNYGVELPAHRVKGIVTRWRAANRWAVEFWRKLELAARRAVLKPNEIFTAGRVSYVRIGAALHCILPDQSSIQYCDVRYEPSSQTVTCIKPSLKPKVDDKEWPRMRLWGGLLAENVTQAVAGCLMRDLLADLIDEPVVAHVHDEVVLEVPTQKAESEASYLRKLMELPPDWAEGLPLKAVPEIVSRYGK